MEGNRNYFRIRDSAVISGLTWLGPQVPYTGTYKADTYPLTWADDDLIYLMATFYFPVVGAMGAAVSFTGRM